MHARAEEEEEEEEEDDDEEEDGCSYLARDVHWLTNAFLAAPSPSAPPP